MKEINPRIRVIGVQTAVLPSMKARLEAGEPRRRCPRAHHRRRHRGRKRPASIRSPASRSYVDEIVTVDEEEIANAILLLLEREKTVAEGAGAAALAALSTGVSPLRAARRPR